MIAYPKGYRENLAYRAKMLRQCAKDKIYREKVRELFFRDPLFAFNTFFFTYDPRKRPRHQQPFCTYEYQDMLITELVEAINNGEDIGIEKSRDMGATWCVLLVFLWFWLNPSGGADFLLGSRIEDYVDKRGDPRTHFEKVRYALYRLPGWLRPKGFQKNNHDNFLRLLNPMTGASLTGESNNANFSTQGRYAAILYDEFAKWEHTDESAWTAGGDASPSRIPISTPFGAGGKYYEVVTDGKTNVLTLHWTLHPEKSFGLYCVYPPPNLLDKDQMDNWEPEVKLRSPWYDRECLRRRPTEIAQELDIDYLGAGNPVFDGKAAISIGFYLKLRKQPKQWYWPNLLQMKLERVDPPRDHEQHVAVYEEPRANGCYTIAGDVVEGVDGGDFAVCKVYCRDTKSVVASYYNVIDEVQFAKVMYLIHEKYYVGDRKDYTWITPETNNMGIATFNRLLDMEVPNLFMMPKYDTTKQSITYKKGWVTSASSGSRNELIAGIREWLIGRDGFVDARCCGELSAFIINKNGKAIAKSGCHDDEVITFGICIQMDILCPYESPKVLEEPVLKDTREFDLASCKIEEDTSIEGMCLQTILSKNTLESRVQEQEAFYASEDMYF